MAILTFSLPKSKPLQCFTVIQNILVNPLLLLLFYCIEKSHVQWVFANFCLKDVTEQSYLNNFVCLYHLFFF